MATLKTHAENHDDGAKASGRDPLVETSYETGPLCGAGPRPILRTHARVRLGAAAVGGALFYCQELTATVGGASRYDALVELERHIVLLLAAVQTERHSAHGKDYSAKCGCHSCCTLSCCNPPLDAAWMPE